MARYCGIVSLLLLSVVLISVPVQAAGHPLVDMKNRNVTLDLPVQRVITAGYCFSPCAMAALGVEDRIIATGGAISAITNETIATFLIPDTKSLPDLGRGYKINLEAAAALKPDLIILEMDGAGQGDSLVEYGKLIEKLDLFQADFPTVVLTNPACSNPPDITSIYKEISLLGKIFEKQERAQEIIDFLSQEVSIVSERTEGIPDDQKPRALFMCLAGGADFGKGALAMVMPDGDCATLYPHVSNVKNAYEGESRALMSAEQLLAIDPDLIILVRSPAGYEVKKLYDEEYYTGIKDMKAIRDHKVFSTGQFELHRNHAGLEFPIELLIEAKATYPERFQDISVDEMLSNHYRTVYGLDSDQIEDLKVMMGVDWMGKTGF
ncbi:MAG: ABC transporter substrate-binding protein [Methanotrichaceae archaeon]|nr:ABC transporter substrate-binding protein [Methanotrichaceae archaeon]